MATSKDARRRPDAWPGQLFVQALTSYYIPDDLIMNILSRLLMFIYLWNPATEISTLLPPPHCLATNFAMEHVGFGFDPLVNDYKVIRIRHTFSGDTHALVYSTNANAWKEIECPKKRPHRPICDACVNGVLYWARDRSMLRYDLNNEVFSDHNYPANVLRTGYGNFLYARILEMKDSIAIITYTTYTWISKSKVNLWTI
ncbi:F-box protein At1g47340-like [Apium graveolens]|uniref:F-box protein At1g47340-like n=1 Tax=Apium graveolens TaxID=4045 RepID=UPI003D7BC043